MTSTETAHAKINLYLHVTGRRDDGYHLLDSLVVFAGACDQVAYQPAEAALNLTLGGTFGAALPVESAQDNLVMRAAHALRAEIGAALVPGGSLTLAKELPIASGIGGGSADAAATLRLLARSWNLRLPAARMAEIALGLGADVPVCIAQCPARMGGIGEVLEAAPVLPDCGIVLVNCGLEVSTPAVFKARNGGFTPRAEMPARWASALAMAADLRRMRNDLEEAACALCPEIRRVLASIAVLPDCRLARMSGSGATCFGIFDTPALAREAASLLAGNGWWVWGGGLV